MTNTYQLLYRYFILLAFVSLAIACGSKATKESQKSVEATKSLNQDTVKLSNEGTFDPDAGKWGNDSVATRTNYSLFREFYKQKSYDDAIAPWRYVYKNAPALRKTTYLNGITMYEHYAESSTDSLTKQAYVDSMFMVYDQRIEYFGEEGSVTAWKAYKLKLYRSWDNANYNEWVKKSFEIEGEESEYFILYAYFKKTMQNLNAKLIDVPKVEEVYNALSDAVDYNVEQEHKYTKNYKKEQAKIDKLYEALQAKLDDIAGKNAKTCPDIKNYYDSKYRQNPNDLKMLKTYYGKLSRAKCKTDPVYQELANKLYELEPTASRAKMMAQKALNSGNHTEAANFLQKALELESDRTKQAGIYMFLAGVERRKVQNLTSEVARKARTYALKAAELNPGWGKPYIFIGELYASSGPLCGSGRGWNSQVVTWAATDAWQKAKEIDPSVAAEANKNINNYAQYYPMKDEGFMKSIMSGQSYKIGCWIGTTTTARFR
ncbi:MAG: tetratricopeptide repeat protein [Chitinophagales bacterium]